MDNRRNPKFTFYYFFNSISTSSFRLLANMTVQLFMKSIHKYI